MELNPAPSPSPRKGLPRLPGALVSVRGVPLGVVGTVLELHPRTPFFYDHYSVLVCERVCYVKRSDLEPLQ